MRQRALQAASSARARRRHFTRRRNSARGAVGLAVEEDLALLQEIGAIRGILPVVLVPGPVLGPPVPVGHAARDQEHVRPLGLEELGQGLVVRPRGLEAADDLPAPGRPLRLLDPRPELREAPGGVRDREGRHHDPGVGVPQMGHVLPLRDVEADEEPVPLRPESLLELAKALDSDCV